MPLEAIHKFSSLQSSIVVDYIHYYSTGWIFHIDMMKLRILLIASYLFPLGFGIPLGLDLLFPQTILEASTVTVTVTEPLPSCVTCLNPSSTSDLPELTGPAPTTLGVDGTVVAAYYADWASAILPPEDVDFKRFNWIDFGMSSYFW